MPLQLKKRFGPGEGLDPSWIAVDQYTFTTLHPHTRPNHSALEQTLTRSAISGLPPIYSSRSFGKFLALQCRFGGVKHALDVGTLGGYSAIWMATMNPGMRVTSFEYSEHHAAVARQNFEEAGVADRIDLRVGPAAENLPRLLEEIEAGKAERVGFAFIDADKINNWTYCDFAIRMGGAGTCICVDNIVQHGRLASEEAQEPDGIKGARIAVEAAGKDERIESVVMQVVGERNYDGFLMCVVK
ncbi:O-methyltransferas-like protein family 3 [Macrophomina phaseolina]|uniref:O-methyltransferas-like protein family 3 n=1 Tax=Macrophomina phaseolina TaxID=35725 RepID=A0ABQ8GWC1_9PEZI|nr:O-methyltransferas-like protein family 3 [Macrophomina phaseolina]